MYRKLRSSLSLARISELLLHHNRSTLFCSCTNRAPTIHFTSFPSLFLTSASLYCILPKLSSKSNPKLATFSPPLISLWPKPPRTQPTTCAHTAALICHLHHFPFLLKTSAMNWKVPIPSGKSLHTYCGLQALPWHPWPDLPPSGSPATQARSPATSAEAHVCSRPKASALLLPSQPCLPLLLSWDSISHVVLALRLFLSLSPTICHVIMYSPPPPHTLTHTQELHESLGLYVLNK